MFKKVWPPLFHQNCVVCLNLSSGYNTGRTIICNSLVWECSLYFLANIVFWSLLLSNLCIFHIITSSNDIWCRSLIQKSYLPYLSYDNLFPKHRNIHSISFYFENKNYCNICFEADSSWTIISDRSKIITCIRKAQMSYNIWSIISLFRFISTPASCCSQGGMVY